MTTLATVPLDKPVKFTVSWTEEQVTDVANQLYINYLAGNSGSPTYLPPAVKRQVWLRFLNERPQMTGEQERTFREAFQEDGPPAMTTFGNLSHDLTFRSFPASPELPPHKTVQEMVDETRTFLSTGKTVNVNLYLLRLHHELSAEEVVRSRHIGFSAKAKFLAVSPSSTKELVEEFLQKHPEVLQPEHFNSDCNLITHPHTPLDLLAQEEKITWRTLLEKDKSGAQFFRAWQSGMVNWKTLISSSGINTPLFEAIEVLAKNLPDADLRQFFTDWMKAATNFHASGTALPFFSGLLNRPEPLTDISLYEDLIPKVGVLNLWNKTGQTIHLETLWGRLLRSRDYHSNQELSTLLRLIGGVPQAYKVGLGELGIQQMRAETSDLADLPDQFLWNMFETTWLR